MSCNATVCRRRLHLARDLKTISNVPICLMTARAQPEDRIEGLETGVDDFISKPFEPRELVLRLRNIVRRGREPSGPREEIKMGDYVFHVTRGELKRGPEGVKLTERERDLLRLFAQRPGVLIGRHELAGDDPTGNERAIDVQTRLRRKIEIDPANPLYLQTVHGKGLYFPPRLTCCTFQTARSVDAQFLGFSEGRKSNNNVGSWHDPDDLADAARPVRNIHERKGFRRLIPAPPTICGLME